MVRPPDDRPGELQPRRPTACDDDIVRLHLDLHWGTNRVVGCGRVPVARSSVTESVPRRGVSTDPKRRDELETCTATDQLAPE
ncbi:hypothetical protein LC1Hm_1279 [Halomicrobium sp. LC1Hm]|nr:hypothetical protein LC1Hm_1279 [Halomicrobium sp. LC1Hm]